jgi:tRNA G10  N-methylase Trm11
MEYFFILGRNPELSRAELCLYLEARGIDVEELFFEGNLLVLNLKRNFEFQISHFGGVISLGKLEKFNKEKDLIEFLSKNEFVEMDKFTYSVFGNIDSSVFSDKFKKERKKAQIRNSGKRLKFQSGEQFIMPNSDVGIFAQKIGSNIYLGLVEQSFSSKEVEKRDMGKPIRRESLAISPRLARILINLSGAKQGDLILDPFCGVGGIIQEAVLMNISCVGIDRDFEAIKGAKENLNWLKENYSFNSSYELFNSNSINAKNNQYDAIIAESSLGEVLRKKLKGKQAESYLEDFKREIIPLLRKFREIKKKNAKIAITFPCFENVQISGEEICDSTGLKVYSSELVEFPVIEKREKQFVNRQIWVFY